MTATLTPTPKQQFFDNNGNPLAGGKLYSYTAGTTSPAVTYVDSAGSTTNTNPIILDSRGEANVWLGTGTYKFKLVSATDVEIWTVDNIPGAPAADAALVALAASNGSSLVGFIQSGTGAVATTVQSKLRESVSVKDFGAVGDGVTDDTVAIQAALNYAALNNCGVYVPFGTYIISTTLKLGTSTRLHGDSMINSIIKMKATPTGAKPTYTGSTSYPPTLDYFPMLWNASPVQWFSINNLCLDGNGCDVYGLRLQENFYGSITNTVIINCNQRPYINVRGQNLFHENFVVYQNKGGALTFDNTGVTFQNCGFERLGTATALEVRTPVSTKTGTALRDCWFEDDVAPYNTTAVWIKISGRNPIIENCYFAHVGTSITGIQTIGVADTLTFDGISTPNASGAINGRFVVNYAAGTTTTIFSSDSFGCDLKGQFSTVTDNNGNNVWDNIAVNYPYKIVGANGFEWGTPSGSFFKLDPANNRVALFGTATYLRNSSGVLEVVGNLGSKTRFGTDIEVQPKANSNVYVYDAAGSSTYLTGHIVLGTRHIWYDPATGNLRHKNGAPASATDGVILSANPAV